MKRNLDLVRGILLWIEEQPEGQNIGWKLSIDGFTEEEIGYHVYLMHQAGLLIAADGTSGDSPSPYWIPIALTWDGHEFISATRDATLWAKTKRLILSTSGDVSVSALTAYLKDQAQALLLSAIS